MSSSPRHPRYPSLSQPAVVASPPSGSAAAPARIDKKDQSEIAAGQAWGPLGDVKGAWVRHTLDSDTSSTVAPAVTSGFHRSLWTQTFAVPHFRPLTEDADADICIIGAGIAGLSVAYMCLRAGLSVVVLEDGDIASGETGRTTAHLSNAFDDHYAEMRDVHGVDGIRTIAQSHSQAIDLIENICQEEGIVCDFQRINGYLITGTPANATPPSLQRFLDHELAAARDAGLNVDFVPRVPTTEFDTGRALLFPRQGQFHPVKYMAGLATAVDRRGGRIFTDTHATRVLGGGAARVETERGTTVTCRHIVVATNTPVNDLITMHTKQYAYRSYVIGLLIPKALAPRYLLWDVADPYHYVRSQPLPHDPMHDMLIVGGEDHQTGRAKNFQQRYAMLERWARERFPQCKDVKYKWSGQVMEPADGVGFIGRNPGDHSNVYIVTGDSGNGMTNGTLAGLLIRDLVMNRWNPWARLYDPSRIPIHNKREYLREALQTQVQYGAWLKAGEVSSEEEVPPGEGRILRKGITPIAVFRDAATGEIRRFSAVCPHAKGILTWNNDEKTWDCPVHGSRFDPHGSVMNGPSNSNLKPA